MTRRKRDLVEVIDQHHKDIVRLRAALGRAAAAGHTHADYSLTSHTHSYLPLAGGTLTGGLTLGGILTLDTAYASNNPGGGQVAVDWSSNWWRYRFGGTSTPAGIIVSDYDTPMIYLGRDGDIEMRGDELVINSNAATQFDGALIVKQETSGVARMGFYNAAWKTNFTLGHTTMDFYADGAIALHLEQGTASASSSTYRGSYIHDNVTLGSTSGNRRYIGGFRGKTSNEGFLDFMHIRTAAGSTWTTASFGVQRRTDATNQSSLWFDTTYLGFGISDPDTYAGHTFNGRINCKPTTTGSTHAGAWASLGGSYYSWYRNTSSERYKHDIDYDTEWLADIQLQKATSTFRHDDGKDYISFIAERVFEAFGEDERSIVRDDETGLIENYQRDAVVAALVEKVARLERIIKQRRAA